MHLGPSRLAVSLGIRFSLLSASGWEAPGGRLCKLVTMHPTLALSPGLLHGHGSLAGLPTSPPHPVSCHYFKVSSGFLTAWEALGW